MRNISYNKSKDITLLYLHCSTNLVKTGDCVKKGDSIAVSGAVGAPAHLHIELRKGKELKEQFLDNTANDNYDSRLTHELFNNHPLFPDLSILVQHI